MTDSQSPEPTPSSSPESSPASELQSEITKRGRDVWLAGLGALATVEEEGTKLFSRLVDRGKAFEDERRKQIEEVAEQAEQQGEEALAQLEQVGEESRSMLTQTVNDAMERFGVPTRKEVDRLSDRVERLTEQVDKLARAVSAEHGEAKEDRAKKTGGDGARK
jgi:poly(hydroxyalkanoate) granule-associated protein